MDCETLASLKQVDLVIFPANDIFAKSELLSQFKAQKGMMTTPTDFFCVDHDTAIGDDNIKSSKELNERGILFATPTLKSVEELLESNPF